MDGLVDKSSNHSYNYNMDIGTHAVRAKCTAHTELSSTNSSDMDTFCGGGRGSTLMEEVYMHGCSSTWGSQMCCENRFLKLLSYKRDKLVAIANLLVDGHCELIVQSENVHVCRVVQW